jgi:hypothetical protein
VDTPEGVAMRHGPNQDKLGLLSNGFFELNAFRKLRKNLRDSIRSVEWRWFAVLIKVEHINDNSFLNTCKIKTIIKSSWPIEQYLIGMSLLHHVGFINRPLSHAVVNLVV